jgi:glycosyltransferase involved in cell wall biosynthesis
MHTGQLLQPVPGGIGIYQRALLKHLPATGVDLVAFAAGPRPAGVAPHVPWVDLGRPTGSARYELWHRFRRFGVEVDADLIHAPSLAVPPPSRRPLVVTIHDVVFLRQPEVMTRRGVRFHRRGLDLARREAARVIVPSAFTRRELLSEGFAANRIDLAPFGVEAPTPRDEREVDEAVAQAGVTPPFVFTVGTVEPRKDMITIVHAVEKLRSTHPDLTLAIVGPRGWGAVGDLHRPFVRVLGAQPWSTVDALYRRASACVIASRYEGFGLPAVEAMVRGAPTIATTGSALEEVVSGAGMLFAPGDIEACSNAIGRVLDDNELRARLAHDARARASEFTWPSCAEAHAHAYARAAAGAS